MSSVMEPEAVRMGSFQSPHEIRKSRLVSNANKISILLQAYNGKIRTRKMVVYEIISA